MDKERIKKGQLKRPEIRMYEELCTQNYPPACNTKCPMHVDVKGICEAIADGNFSAAQKLYRKSIVFPRILSCICDEPCRGFCRRGELGDSVLIAKLERAAMEYGSAMVRKIRPLKKREQRIAIVGGGLDGLTAAMFLYEKGYQITVLDKDRIGGRIWAFVKNGQLSEDDIAADFSLFENGDIAVERREFANADEAFAMLKENGGDYDFVYDTIFNPVTLENGYGQGSIIQKLADGRARAITIDREMQKVSLTEGRENEGPYDTKLYVNLQGFEKSNAVIDASATDGLTEEQAMIEANRCIRCECMECVKECKYLELLGDYPKKHVREIANNLNITMGIRQSKGMVNGCSICGLCKKRCPNGLDMAEVCMVAKVGLVDIYAMPEAEHDFPVRDMEHANGAPYKMFRHEPGMSSSKYAFFPGCQLGALEPMHITRAYSFLRENLSGGVALALGCCGAPVYWSGRMKDFEKTVADFRAEWEDMGCPILITACSSCMQIFADEAPDIKTKSLWEIYDTIEGAVTPASGAANFPQIAIHDACTARDQMEVQAAVRSLIEKRGYKISELENTGELTKCCGYGGLVNFTDKQVCSNMVESRTSESESDYAVYCAMCKDLLTAGGKPSWHILDILYGNLSSDEKSTEKMRLTYSRRRENREKLKQKMLKEVWNEDAGNVKEDYENINIVFDENLEAVADERLILESDIKQVIYNAEQTNCKVLNPKNGHLSASYKPGIITYWVEYAKEGDAYHIFKVYSHRLEINKKIKENEHRKYRI